jgi:hypothetical protein
MSMKNSSDNIGNRTRSNLKGLMENIPCTSSTKPSLALARHVGGIGRSCLASFTLQPLIAKSQCQKKTLPHSGTEYHLKKKKIYRDLVRL